VTPARILIVDDEPFNVDYLEQELDGLGFVTDTATNGLEALERVAEAPPDLVLLDVMMPGMDGISALRILKGDAETRLIPVVLMTALNALEDRVRGIEAGADDFLSKPVDDRELLARIRTALRQKRSIDETVGELRSASDHLERFGRQERDVAVLAIEWRLKDSTLPRDAVSFVARRRQAAAEAILVDRGGTLSEADGSSLVAVFDGPDPRARALAAVEAAFAVADEDPAAAEMTMSAAVGVGPATVGSTRLTDAAGSRWAYGVGGLPVERAARLAGRPDHAGILLTAEAAAVVSDRLALEALGDGAYRVVGPADGADEADATPDRSLRTILVTDIVDSTRTAERLGDRAWNELLRAHEQAVRGELVLFGGREVDTTGDGFLVSFESPARAIRFALALRDRVSALGLAIRVGAHTGEVECVDGKARGIALNVASRIAARAGPGEILVSATTRELSAGARLAFADRGEHSLKGVSEPRRLFALIDERGQRVEDRSELSERRTPESDPDR
jgi:DNA-binding response OmpR family regulator